MHVWRNLICRRSVSDLKVQVAAEGTAAIGIVAELKKCHADQQELRGRVDALESAVASLIKVDTATVRKLRGPAHTHPFNPNQLFARFGESKKVLARVLAAAALTNKNQKTWLATDTIYLPEVIYNILYKQTMTQ